jgi:hypothetical protein
VLTTNGFALGDTSLWLSFTPGQAEYQSTSLLEDFKGLGPELSDWKRLGADVPLADAVAFVETNLSRPFAEVEVRPGGVKDIERIAPFSWQPSAIGGLPLRARLREDLPTTLRTLVLEKAVETKSWSFIRDVLISPDLTQVSRTIEQRLGRTVWVAWLLGNLPFRSPAIWAWSSPAVSEWYNKFAKSAWGRVVATGRGDMTTVRRAAYTAEVTTRNFLRRQDVRLGG